MSKYSIVIPLYNSSKILPDLYKRVLEVMESLKVEFELILVNDASSDNSWEVMKLLREKDKRVKIISFTRNFGQHPALLCGMKYASGDYVITMDDDLQHPPEEIPKLIKILVFNNELKVYKIPND